MKIVIIGMTKCDKDRESRERDIENITKRSNIELKKYDPTAIVALPSLDYWQEALSCYQNGAYMASALMCRCATEWVVYCAITRRENIPKNFTGGTIKIDFAFVDKKWGDILAFAKEYGIINGKLENKINKIREKGNYVAHHGPIIDKSYQNFSKNIKIKADWIGKKDCLQIINHTIEIINTVLKNLAEISE